MKLVGLTGGISTGKSTVSHLLAAQGIPIIDADKIAREIVAPGQKANKLVRKHFGDEVFLEDGNFDRKKLGDIIFQNPEKRKILNSCTHPFVRKEMVRQALLYYIKGADVVVFDVPLLYESKLDGYMGTNAVVYCSDILQLQRLKKRDNISEEDALKRISAQMPISEKVEKADIVLDNSSDLKQLEIQVKNMVKKIKPSTFTWLLEYLGLPAALVLSVAFIKYLTPVVLGWF